MYERDGIRVNAVCPGVTETEMTKGVIGTFKQQDLYWQSAGVVGNIIVGLTADASIVGRAYYIEGGDAWEFEDKFYSTQPQWLSEEGFKRMRTNLDAVMKVVHPISFVQSHCTDQISGSSHKRVIRVLGI